MPKDQVVFGCTVKVKDLEFGDTEEFILVGTGEEDYDVFHLKKRGKAHQHVGKVRAASVADALCRPRLHGTRETLEC